MRVDFGTLEDKDDPSTITFMQILKGIQEQLTQQKLMSRLKMVEDSSQTEFKENKTTLQEVIHEGKICAVKPEVQDCV